MLTRFGFIWEVKGFPGTQEEVGKLQALRQSPSPTCSLYSAQLWSLLSIAHQTAELHPWAWGDGPFVRPHTVLVDSLLHLYIVCEWPGGQRRVVQKPGGSLQ